MIAIYKVADGDNIPVFPGKIYSIKQTSRQGYRHRWSAKKFPYPLHPPAGHRDTARTSRAVGEAHVKKKDLTRLSDDAVDSWMNKYAPGVAGVHAEFHGFKYIRRATGLRLPPEPVAVEHYFHESVFWYLWFCC